MILLNVGCGSILPGEPWINMDLGGSAAVHHDITQPWPFPNEHVDGVFANHVLEHFDCLTAVRILKESHRVLKVGGCCRIVVPSASHFRATYAKTIHDPEGTAVEFYGETLNANHGGHPSFMDWALFWGEHHQLLTEDSLWCEFVDAGFHHDQVKVAEHQATGFHGHYTSGMIAFLDNRPHFSLRMEAVKTTAGPASPTIPSHGY